jgi:hypothetical protein
MRSNAPDEALDATGDKGACNKKKHDVSLIARTEK